MKSVLDITLNFLKFRPRSVFEVTQKLKQKNIEEKEIKETVKVLKRNGLLDDAEFAKMYVRDRNLLKPTGSYLLRLELKKLGLSENNIEDAMINQDEEDLARRALESKHRYQDAEFEKKAQFLQRRGFGMNIVMKVLRSEN